MDKIETISQFIIKYNQYEDGEIPHHLIIKEVCALFDRVKASDLSCADKQLLYDIATRIGVPQYFDMLEKFNQNTDLPILSLQNFANTIYESTLHTSDGIKLHKLQKEVLDIYCTGQNNRYFLSASTSFGKTFLVYEIINKMKYKNILLVFPTIALLSENLTKMYSDPRYHWIKEQYKIHTISNISPDDLGEYNIFIYTPERYLSFLDFKQNVIFDFAFVDEVYKIDNEYLIDEEMKENERDIAYRVALFYTFMNDNIDVLLAGPYIEFSDKNSDTYNPSFDLFLESNQIGLLNYNEYEIVNKDFLDIKTKKTYCIDGLNFSLGNIPKTQKFKNIIQTIFTASSNVIVYCYSRVSTEKYARHIVDDGNFSNIDTAPFADFLAHLQTIYDKSEDWIVVQALKKGIGIHHGLIPKYIQKEIITLFNEGYIRALLSTTTITEGVNTTAKNILVLSHMKGSKVLKNFDALNIAGRAGRFLHHYKGNVITLDSEFLKIKDSISDPIRHKNYDNTVRKGDVDIFYTKDEFLSENERTRKATILHLKDKFAIPDEILEQYKIVSYHEKIAMFQKILELSEAELNSIEKLITYFQRFRNVLSEGVETIIKVVLPYVKNEDLKFLMEHGREGQDNKYLTALLYTYLSQGFRGMVDYGCTHQGKSIDDAVRDTAKFVYNTLKYQVVKYFGAFNLMYKYYISLKTGASIQEGPGIDALLLRLEYNANTEKGRLASDYGVPQRIIDYYDADNEQAAKKIYNDFDTYEKVVFRNISLIIHN